MSLLNTLDGFTLDYIHKMVHLMKMKDVNDEFSDIVFFHNNAEQFKFVEHVHNGYYKIYIRDTDADEANIRRKIRIPFCLSNVLKALDECEDESE